MLGRRHSRAVPVKQPQTVTSLGDRLLTQRRVGASSSKVAAFPLQFDIDHGQELITVVVLQLADGAAQPFERGLLWRSLLREIQDVGPQGFREFLEVLDAGPAQSVLPARDGNCRLADALPELFLLEPLCLACFGDAGADTLVQVGIAGCIAVRWADPVLDVLGHLHSSFDASTIRVEDGPCVLATAS